MKTFVGFSGVMVMAAATVLAQAEAGRYAAAGSGTRTGGSPAPQDARAVLANAAAVWHFGSAQSSDEKRLLSVHGDVKLGVELHGTDREASIARGGDGRVARFDGGYLRTRAAGDRALELRGQQMTLYVRLQDPSGQWAAPIFSKAAPDDPYGSLLSARDRSLRYLWKTEPAARRVTGSAAGTSPASMAKGPTAESMLPQLPL